MDTCKIGLDFLGGAMEVGASSVLVEMCGQRILLDAGIRQKAGADPLPDFRRIQEKGGLDAIVVSHAHMDHTGSLPVISKAYPNARIYMTSMTIDLTRVLLYDSIKLMNRQEEGIPAYAEKDVEQLFGRMLAVHYEQPMEILPGITLTMYQAGHIAGAACVYLTSREGSLFYSGDFSAFAQNTIEGIRIPKLRPDVAIVESTYGDRLHSNRQVEEQTLVDTAAECIEKGGKMLIPTFALGRAQEVLLILKRAMNRGELPKTKVYVDGMVRDMNIAYSRNPWFLKNALAKKAERGGDLFYSDEIVAVEPKDNRDDLLKTAGPAIFVASSGMLTGGPSVEYARKIAPMENGYIVITGYQDEEAPGRQIVELLDSEAEDRVLTLGGTRVPVRCTLRRAGLSAHADKAEIESLLERLSARNVFLVHGDKDVIPALAKSLQLDYRTRVFVPKDGDSEEIFLKSPRQQLKKSFPWSMQRVGSPDGKECELYHYLQEHYPNGKFTIAELDYIWSGRHNLSEEELEAFQETLSASPYFERDGKRLFLFVCRSEEDIREDEKKANTMTPQRLQQEIEECFDGFPYRKISYFMEKEEVLLLFDFPREVEERFDRAAELFWERTGWTARKSEEPNEHAMQTYLHTKLGNAVQKISIRKMDSAVVVRLLRMPGERTTENQPTENRSSGIPAYTSGKPDDSGSDVQRSSEAAEPEQILEETAREFERKTGYRLIYEGEAVKMAAAGEEELSGDSSRAARKAAACRGADADGRTEKDFFLPSVPGDGKTGKPGAQGNPVKPVEQNLAMSCIDLEFAGENYAPYKKSIMNDQYGKFIQLSFLSPGLGLRQKEILQRIADQTGWRVRIAPGVNQNAIQSLAQRICRENGVDLRKLPSYLPGTKTLVLKPAAASEKMDEICRILEEETGIACRAE
ncbi:MAG: MBL fold metallo-hydrolase [Lachnospiraceae bacterium]|nr:MBL fold metallo-hydrolase [Lachnospiraceae bacterium]